MVRKVVGVGSVGTRCLILLLESDDGTPLFLQIKQATKSVLEQYLGSSIFEQSGQRVVEGQQLIQATSDMFLGCSGTMQGGNYYWRQFHDMKGSADVAAMNSQRLQHYGEVCGWTLAHAHARSGDAISIAAYIGSGKSFAKALTAFAVAYADQNEADYDAFRQAIDDGRIKAHEA